MIAVKVTGARTERYSTQREQGEHFSTGGVNDWNIIIGQPLVQSLNPSPPVTFFAQVPAMHKDCWRVLIYRDVRVV